MPQLTQTRFTGGRLTSKGEAAAVPQFTHDSSTASAAEVEAWGSAAPPGPLLGVLGCASSRPACSCDNRRPFASSCQQPAPHLTLVTTPEPEHEHGHAQTWGTCTVCPPCPGLTQHRLLCMFKILPRAKTALSARLVRSWPLKQPTGAQGQD